MPGEQGTPGDVGAQVSSHYCCCFGPFPQVTKLQPHPLPPNDTVGGVGGRDEAL